MTNTSNIPHFCEEGEKKKVLFIPGGTTQGLSGNLTRYAELLCSRTNPKDPEHAKIIITAKRLRDIADVVLSYKIKGPYFEDFS